MTTCVYRVEFSKSSIELNDDYEILSDHEKEWISQLDAESFFDYNNKDNNYICFVITTPLEIKKYLEILAKNFIESKCEDLSKKILTSEIDLSEILRKNITPLNSVKWSFFLEDLENWILSNLEIDMVLDRISEVGGIKKLSKIEKEFLKNFQLP